MSTPNRAGPAPRTPVKTAQATDWGGYGGYFADPHGYLWEVSWGSNTEFEEDGTIKV